VQVPAPWGPGPPVIPQIHLSELAGVRAKMLGVPAVLLQGLLLVVLTALGAQECLGELLMAAAKQLTQAAVIAQAPAKES